MDTERYLRRRAEADGGGVMDAASKMQNESLPAMR
jgi:hypothetical protein